MVSSENVKLIVVGALFSVGAAALVAKDTKWRTIPKGIHDKGYADRSAEAEIGDEFDGDLLENYFQDMYMHQAAPNVLEFGHVYENPRQWEQRYEKRDFESNRHQGKVRWSDKEGSHGEHYWDFNHSGRT